MGFLPSLLSIENEIIEKLNYNDVIREYAFNRARNFYKILFNTCANTVNAFANFCDV